MAKLYVFGIGGTGARVIRSLTMLLASGVETNFDIVPILIDPDRAGGDKNRTEKILKEYQLIHKEINGFPHCHFFKNTISTLSQITGGNGNLMDGFSSEIDGVQDEKFKDFIGYAGLDPNNKFLADLLFSKRNLNANLQVGFKGNPNIGSIVLNQFTKSEAFQAFADSFEEDDRIFIVSSIFGGTGASGFPLLLKNIRNGHVNKDFYDYLHNSVIGAITVQPYFKVKQDDHSEIDSHGFISKTKAALHYYFKNVTGNNTINALYYIGDLTDNTYDNHEGGAYQRNDAHFVELASAMAIVDFANIDKNHISTNHGKAVNPVYKEFGIKELISQVGFNELATETKDLFARKVTEYFYFNLFTKEKLSQALAHPYATAYTNKFDANFFNQTFFKTVSEFNKSFRIWLAEMHRNKISFSPFLIEPVVDNNNEVIDFKIGASNIFSLVRNIPEKKSAWYKIGAGNHYELFIVSLNKAAEEVKDTTTPKRLMGVFSKASRSVVTQKIF